MRKAVVLPLLMLAASVSFGQGDRTKVMDRVRDAGTILNEIMSAPDAGIPDNVMGSAKCVAVIPSYLKGAFVVGASYGKGLASCRTTSGWSAPAFFRIEGGSFGFQ